MHKAASPRRARACWRGTDLELGRRLDEDGILHVLPKLVEPRYVRRHLPRDLQRQLRKLPLEHLAQLDCHLRLDAGQLRRLPVLWERKVEHALLADRHADELRQHARQEARVLLDLELVALALQPRDLCLRVGEARDKVDYERIAELRAARRDPQLATVLAQDPAAGTRLLVRTTRGSRGQHRLRNSTAEHDGGEVTGEAAGKPAAYSRVT